MTRAKRRLYTPQGLCLSVLLAALSLRLAVAMLTSLYGPISFGVETVAEPVRYGLWLVDDDLRTERDGVAIRVGSWQRILEQATADGVEVLYGTSLAALREQKVSVILVPSGRTLGEAEASALQRFIATGGGALLIGSVGTSSTDGRWRGYRVMEQLLDVSVIVPLSEQASRAFEVGRPSELLSGRFASNERLALVGEPGVTGIRNPGAELMWLRDDTQRAPTGARAASMRGEFGEGRLVWIGAGPESSARGDSRALRLRDGIYLDSLRWLCRKPVISLLPGTSRSAAGEALDVRDSAWDRIRARVSVEGNQRLRVEVTNALETPVDGAVLRLYFNRETREATVAATTLLQAVPKLERPSTGAWLDLAMPQIVGGASQSLLVDTPGTTWQ